LPQLFDYFFEFFNPIPGGVAEQFHPPYRTRNPGICPEGRSKYLNLCRFQRAKQ
jgi:hypothetical protein